MKARFLISFSIILFLLNPVFASDDFQPKNCEALLLQLIREGSLSVNGSKYHSETDSTSGRLSPEEFIEETKKIKVEEADLVIALEQFRQEEASYRKALEASWNAGRDYFAKQRETDRKDRFNTWFKSAASLVGELKERTIQSELLIAAVMNQKLIGKYILLDLDDGRGNGSKSIQGYLRGVSPSTRLGHYLSVFYTDTPSERGHWNYIEDLREVRVNSLYRILDLGKTFSRPIN